MLIEFNDVSVALHDRLVLQGVSLRLSEQRIGVIGANGSGKSTLARLLNGLVLPVAGTVQVAGLDTVRDTQAVRRKVGFMFQNPDNQIVFPVVSEDIAFGLRNLRVPKAQIPARVDEMLESLGIAHLRERPSHALSGGEKQMVALAAVLVMAPELVVFDEPTTLLDLGNRNRFRDTLRVLPQAAVVITHDLELLEDFDRVLVVADGGVAHDSTPAGAIAWYTKRFS